MTGYDNRQVGNINAKKNKIAFNPVYTKSNEECPLITTYEHVVLVL